MRTYLDAAPAIYYVEHVAPYAAALVARFTTPGLVCVASDLTRMECLVLPLRSGDTALIQDYESFFSSKVVEIVPFLRTVFDRAAAIRAQHGFKTPDALHLAAAVESACDVFLTNDAHLTAFPDITVEVV
jgi:predicted nucleic acid-binding protein